MNSKRCTRLQIDHKPMESTKGESYLNWMETHFNVQRRLFDYQFSLTTTPGEFERVHQTFIETYNTTAHQASSKTSSTRRFRSTSWGRPRAGSTPRRS